MQAPVLLMLLVTAAVVVWPARRRLEPGQLAPHREASAGDPHGTGGHGALDHSGSFVDRLRVLAHEDPVDVLRAAWRQRASGGGSSREAFDEALLGVLDALEPALVAGLTPARALQLAAPPGSASGPSRASGPSGGSSGAESAGVPAAVQDAVRAAEAGTSIGRVWQRWAEDSGSRTLGFLAAAWLLSERTGAPLAEAVARAAARTRGELSRRRRVSAAVAGPRATVNVLSVLPLVGPLFGLASGLDPSEVYLSSPLVLAAVGLGLVLLLVGRWWCRQLVGSVLEPK